MRRRLRQFRCNLEMVDLEKVTSRKDIAELRQMLEKHFQFTGSTVARRILDSFQAALPKFVKIMPQDYKRVLLERNARGRNASPRRRIRGGVQWVSRPIQGVSAAGLQGAAVDERVKHYREFTIPLRSPRCRRRGRGAWTAASRSATRAAPSETSFPISTTWFIAATGSGDRRPALDEQLPGVHGRVCPAPCEEACVLGITERA